jgi:alpha-1,2-mannosyltransferase
VLAALSWYVAWHVPHSSWLFFGHYPYGFKDLIYRIGDVRRVWHGGPLYLPQDGLQYYTYPPAAIWLFWPLSWTSVFVGEMWWTFASLCSLAWMIASAGVYTRGWRWKKAWAVALLVATPPCVVFLQPVSIHLALGQVGLYLAAAATFDLLCVRGRARGFLVGVTAAIKLYPIVYFAIFVVRREWRALANATAGLVATTAVTWAILPSDSATYFFHRLASGRELRHFWHNDHWIATSSSLYTFMFRSPFTGTPPERTLGLLACVVVIALGIAAAWRQTIEGREVAAFLALALAATIGSPVAWDHYFVWVVLVPFVLVERGRLPWWRVTALGLFVLASVTPLRLARNESLSHHAIDAEFVVIFLARDSFIIASLAIIVACLWPYRSPESAAASSSSQLRSAA